MSELYMYEDLAEAPSLSMVEVRIGTLISTPMVDLSYHPDEHWLKIWFSAELSDDDETLVDGIVDESLGVKDFRCDQGSVFFELVHTDKKRWQKHTRRVNYNLPFLKVPTLALSDASFDGAADIEIINQTERYFDFRVTATRSKHASKGFNSVEFDWRAEAWEA